MSRRVKWSQPTPLPRRGYDFPRSGFSVATRGVVSGAREKGTNGEKLTERTFKNVLARQTLQEQVNDMEVVEDFGSTPAQSGCLSGGKGRGDSGFV